MASARGLAVARWWSAAGYFALIGVAFMFVAMALGFTWAVVIAAALYVAALALLWPMLALTRASEVP